MLLGRWLKTRNWWDEIDDQIVLGALPFARDVSALKELGITGVVNTCQEYAGPAAAYQQFDIQQFRMPTIDFTHPSFDDVCRAVEFIEDQVRQGGKVYIHCKAGRARSATVAMCWYIKSRQLPAKQVQQLLADRRPHINPSIYRRPVVIEFENQFRNTSAV